MLAVRLPKDLEARLTMMAKRSGRTKTFLAREALVCRIDDLEKQYLGEKMCPHCGRSTEKANCKSS
jgi:RHH-type rel operon transcriptional repressor/antitoxin RelB